MRTPTGQNTDTNREDSINDYTYEKNYTMLVASVLVLVSCDIQIEKHTEQIRIKGMICHSQLQ